MQTNSRAWAAIAALVFCPVLMAQTKMPSQAEPITGTFLSVQASNQWLASRLIGLSVYDSHNENIGRISDLVIDQSGAIQAVVVGVGGFLGIAAKDIAVSLRSMTVLRDKDGDRVSVQLTKPEIELAPSFQPFVAKQVKGLPPTSSQPQ